MRSWLHSDTIYLHRVLDPTGSGLSATRLPLPPPPPFRCQLQVQAVSRASGDRLLIGGSHPTTPSLGWINLLARLTELRGTFYLLDYLFILEEYNAGTIGWKRCRGQGMWEGVWGFHDLSECTTVLAPPPTHQPGRSLNPILSGFYGGFIT